MNRGSFLRPEAAGKPRACFLIRSPFCTLVHLIDNASGVQYVKAADTDRRGTRCQESRRPIIDSPSPFPPNRSLTQVTGELFTLTYGALVAQLLKDYEDSDSVNRQLDKIGYNMGLRMIDDFLAKNPTIAKCADMREVADVLAKQGFKLYLGAN